MNPQTMPDHDLNERKIVLEHLASNGWKTEVWQDDRQNGVIIEPEIEAKYEGPILDLYLEYQGKNHFLVFGMLTDGGELLLRLRLYPKNNLLQLLMQITKVQLTLDNDNYPELVKALIPLCDPLLIETEEGLFQLT